MKGIITDVKAGKLDKSLVNILTYHDILEAPVFSTIENNISTSFDGNHELVQNITAINSRFRSTNISSENKNIYSVATGSRSTSATKNKSKQDIIKNFEYCCS